MSSPWIMVLRHDEDGNIIQGSSSVLRDAVRRGADVRTVHSTLDGSVLWNREPSVVHVNFSIVSGVFTGIADTQESSEGRRIATPPVYEWHVYQADGQYHQIEFDRQTSEVVAETKGKSERAWFVRDDWTLLYQHDSSGNAKFGTVSKLIEAIKSGSDIKIKCWDSRSADLQTIIACKSVSVWDEIVSSTTIDLPETNLDLGSGLRLLTGALHWRSHHTTGLREVAEIDRKTGALMSKNDFKAEIYWYGREPQRS